MEKYDLIVIGGGPGGYEAAAEAATVHKMKVALVENRELGGTCLNRGCIPTKALLHSAELLREVRLHGETLGLTTVGDENYDMEKLHARKDEVVEQLVTGVAGLMKKDKVKVYRGLGTIVDQGRVDVALAEDAQAGAETGGTDAQSGGEVMSLEADKILIATGSVPSVPPIPGADNPKVFTSDEMLDLDKPIKSLIVIGGGVIGCEFASVFSSLGVEVTIIEALPRIIANLDKEISRSLTQILKKSRGIDIHTDAMVTEIKEAGDQVTCCYKEKDSLCEATADLVLMAIGRRANTAGLFSDASAASVSSMEMNRGMIVVNANYQTSVPGIYAIGDVIGGIQLAHVATAEGRIAVAHMNGDAAPVDIKTIPSCIYTDPEIASVGISADEAKEAGIAVISKKYSMGANGKSVLSLQERGFIKVIADKDSHKVLGAQMMCARATDMISQFSQAIVCGLTLEDMARTIYPHPTFSEGIGEVLK